MTVEDAEHNSPKIAAIRPKPQAYSQLEEQLDQAEKASTVPLRMLAIARVLTVIFKWNQDNGGTPGYPKLYKLSSIGMTDGKGYVAMHELKVLS